MTLHKSHATLISKLSQIMAWIYTPWTIENVIQSLKCFPIKKKKSLKCLAFHFPNMSIISLVPRQLTFLAKWYLFCSILELLIPPVLFLLAGGKLAVNAIIVIGNVIILEKTATGCTNKCVFKIFMLSFCFVLICFIVTHYACFQQVLYSVFKHAIILN